MPSFHLVTRGTSVIHAKYCRPEQVECAAIQVLRKDAAVCAQSRGPSRLRCQNGKTVRLTSPMPMREKIPHTTMRATVIAQDPFGNDTKILQSTIDIHP